MSLFPLQPTPEETYQAIEDGRFAHWPRAIQIASLLKTDHQGETPLHLAGQTGRLDQIPKDLLTKQNLLTPDENGITPLHCAASGGHLHQIPQDILTQKNLLIPSHDASTPLHHAAWYGHLHQIPAGAFCEEALLQENITGCQPLHYAARNGFLEQIPFPLSRHSLLVLLRHKETCDYSKKWIQKEIQKESLLTAIQKSLHPDL